MRYFLAFILFCSFSADLGAKEAVDAGDGAKYHRFYPDPMTNLLADRGFHLVRMQLSVMALGDKNLELIKAHEPLLRDNLFLLINSKKKSDVDTVEERELLKEEALEVMQNAMLSQLGEPVVEKVLFTQWVIE